MCGTRKPCGKHPLDGEMFLNKNKEQRTKNIGLRDSRVQRFQSLQWLSKVRGCQELQGLQGFKGWYVSKMSLFLFLLSIEYL